ncbi:MAG TPA: hypothetical protein PLU80_23240, partial [Acidobacteriota bacterium]|nr:hypothetical protein [Acidobacteriota bacterium]
MAITIDPIRWWHDPAYFQGWPQLLTHCNSATEGFEILVVCAADIVNRVENFLVPILERTVKRGLEYEPSLAQPEPARGYEGWLKIFLNQEPVNTQPPLRTRFAVPVVETSYLGNRLTIGFSDQPLHRNSIGSINWYGQVITAWRNAWFGFYYEVKVGKPFNFESPRCLSIAGDDAWTSFTAFIKEAIRQYLFDPENRSQVKPEWIQALGFWNAAALADCPYWLVSEYQPVSFPRGYDELEAYAPAQLRRPDEFPFLLHPWVNLAVPKSTTGFRTTTDSGPLPEYEFGSADYGIDSFIPLLKAQGITPFNVLQGPRPENAAFHVVWWKPGPDLQR